MTPEQLAEAHATVIRKHYRRLEDHPGQVHAELLDDLAAIADQHATEAAGARKTHRSTDPKPVA